MTLDLNVLVGQTFGTVERIDDEIWFRGWNSYVLRHEQDCCEKVVIEDIAGDLSDLENTPLVLARRDTSGQTELGYGEEEWTYFNIATIKGHVNIRFYGTSNGCYSMDAELREVKGHEV